MDADKRHEAKRLQVLMLGCINTLEENVPKLKKKISDKELAEMRIRLARLHADVVRIDANFMEI
jgi:hypothetical protein